MKKDVKYILIFMSIMMLIVSYFVYTWINSSNEPGKYDSFAECLTENGVIVYGTEWCHVCQNQKALFGKSFSYINYKDCDSVKEECADAGVEGYPTWQIDGTNYPGLQSLERLASLTDCSL
jgi:hypothetical protein